MTTHLRLPITTVRETIDEHISKALSVQSATTVDVAKPAYLSWDKRVELFLDQAFSKDGSWLESTPKDDFCSAFKLEYPLGLDLAEDVTLDGIRKDVDTKVGRLRQLLTVVDAYPFDAEFNEASTSDEPSSPGEVFIIHGRDEKTRLQVELLVLKRTGKTAIVLSDQPNRGATVIEKFESAFNPASFAIAIMSADDIGGLAGSAGQHPRARQNVLLELGYAMGKLGRSRTAVLYEPTVELPSDMGGIAYYEIDDSGSWETSLLGELQGAGFKVGQPQ